MICGRRRRREMWTLHHVTDLLNGAMFTSIRYLYTCIRTYGIIQRSRLALVNACSSLLHFSIFLRSNPYISPNVSPSVSDNTSQILSLYTLYPLSLKSKVKHVLETLRIAIWRLHVLGNIGLWSFSLHSIYSKDLQSTPTAGVPFPIPWKSARWHVSLVPRRTQVIALIRKNDEHRYDRLPSFISASIKGRTSFLGEMCFAWRCHWKWSCASDEFCGILK